MARLIIYRKAITWPWAVGLMSLEVMPEKTRRLGWWGGEKSRNGCISYCLVLLYYRIVWYGIILLSYCMVLYIVFFKKNKGKYMTTVDPCTLHLFSTKQRCFE